MFLHIGGDVVVLKKDIIAIIDSETGLAGAATKEFLKTCQAEGFFRNINSDEKVKAYVITDREIYLSPISAFTLLKRS
ncbi:MAG: DUF370 domain-containing protein [Clostridia bacterium]|nr:DUF370 domain-containing protein [Clostridia bacterium]